MPEAKDWEDLAQKYVEKNFAYDHLPEALQEISRWHAGVADAYLRNLPANRMRQVALDYLLLAKDAAVRASLEGQP